MGVFLATQSPFSEHLEQIRLSGRDGSRVLDQAD